MFPCLLQNNLRGGEMLFAKEKPRRKPGFLVSQTTFRHRGGYSATNTSTCTLFLNYQGNTNRPEDFTL